MSSSSRKIDRFFLISVSVLTLAGFIIFVSASMGLLARDGASFTTVASKQGISLILGIISFFIFSKIPYLWLRKSALFILIGAILVNLLLFIPSLTFHYNGASRWLSLGLFTFQPSELLKIAFIIYLAAWTYAVRDNIKTFKYGILPYVVIVSVLSLLLLSQRDTDTLVIISGTGLLMLFVAGIKFKHLIMAILLMSIVVGSVVIFRPYALERVKTFINRGSDTQGSGYQINQSLIAIGSGQMTGRGFGQSIQKFGYLPQPTDDSIFAVAAEEFGFIGGFLLIVLYASLLFSIFRIGNRAPDVFAGLLVMGIGILIVSESFMNISAMLGLLPLSGLPLLFVSHGGTALILTLTVSGIVANVSKYATKG
ncbi:cell division protein FtsW [Candidatus Woesebacteria bacterium]|nr:cell division protein FtsW [Candidatus Woesebacteria bacterium]